ncbi:MAG TPA: lipocalin family protein [Devosiaceae bacterium]|jgi:apolipoprotein D and lipocalin family protein|nr:lipocalin family protein [Devosiaceae bacterium]
MAKMMLAATLALSMTVPAALAQDTPSDGLQVEPEAYAGLWYEIARTPAPFEQQCDGGVTAHYALADAETVTVTNRCDLPGGEVSRIEGTAEVLNEDFTQLSVDFPQSPEEAGPNYVIEAVGPQQDGAYAWAVVRGAGEGIGWILSRQPELGDEARSEAEAALEQAGIDPAALQDTPQPPQNYEAASMD